MSDRPPDFSMVRAAEILARIYERTQRTTTQLPAPASTPMTLFNEALTLRAGVTTRSEVERALGLAFAYPSHGWHSYALYGHERIPVFLSLFYAKDALLAAELYVAKSDRAPALQPRDIGGFRLLPGEITVGMNAGALPDSFGRIIADERALYADIFAARFAGGVAYAMGNVQRIERLALYADAATALPPHT
ncbi:MAG: hypothetical protein ACYDHD_08970 [Vulcanimicrobiaceae bacterium]